MEKINKTDLRRKVAIEFYREWEDLKQSMIARYSSMQPSHSIVSGLGIPLKYAGSFAMVPDNLDLDVHFARYPLTDYKFVQDNSGHLKSVNIPPLYFDIERMYHIIGLISSIPANNSDSIDEAGYVHINSTILRNYFKDYLCYLDYLIQTGILEVDDRFEIGVQSKGYKFSAQYENRPFVKYVYQEARQQTSIEAIPSEIFNSSEKRYIANPVLSYPYLSEWYLRKGLTINARRAKRAAHSAMRERLAQGVDFWDTDRTTGGKKNPITQYHAACHCIAALEIKSYNAKIDQTTYRLHSNLTGLKKNYRKYLSYAGRPLSAIDITSSQPYLLILLLNPLFWDPNSDISLNISYLPQKVQERVTEKSRKEILDYLINTPPDVFNRYVNDVLSGEFYEKIIERSSTHMTREDAKKMIMIVLFSQNKGRDRDGFKALFKRCYPEVYSLILLVKRTSHQTLAHILQSIESHIILHRCCSRLWIEFNQTIPVFTIHDSIVTIDSFVSNVKDVMDIELTSAIGKHPKLKIEQWAED